MLDEAVTVRLDRSQEMSGTPRRYLCHVLTGAKSKKSPLAKLQRELAQLSPFLLVLSLSLTRRRGRESSRHHLV